HAKADPLRNGFEVLQNIGRRDPEHLEPALVQPISPPPAMFDGPGLIMPRAGASGSVIRRLGARARPTVIVGAYIRPRCDTPALAASPLHRFAGPPDGGGLRVPIPAGRGRRPG